MTTDTTLEPGQRSQLNVEPEPRRAGVKAKTTTTHVSPVPVQAVIAVAADDPQTLILSDVNNPLDLPLQVNQIIRCI